MSKWYKVVFGDINDAADDEIVVFKEKNNELAVARAMNLNDKRFPKLDLVGLMIFFEQDKPNKYDTNGKVIWDFLNGMN